MFSCHNLTSWRHWIYTTLRQEIYFLHLSLQVCSRADPIFVSVISLVAELNFVIVIVFAWWNNVTKWRHDVIKHAVPISACSSARDIFFCFYSILGCWVQKYHRFYICICGYVITWRHDVTDIIWRHKTHFLYQLVDVLWKWFVACLYGCLSCSIRKCHRICICMMISLHAVTSWSWRPVTI